MLTITAEALLLIRGHDKPIFLELPRIIRNCCFDLQECPVVKVGEPHNFKEYEKRSIQNVTVYLPKRLPEFPLVITVNSIFGMKRLVVEGWRFFD